MLIGTHTINFENAGDDCSKTLETKIRQIKFTTCKAGEFTCDEGLCIDMEQRCDQVARLFKQFDKNSFVVTKQITSTNPSILTRFIWSRSDKKYLRNSLNV